MCGSDVYLTLPYTLFLNRVIYLRALSGCLLWNQLLGVKPWVGNNMFVFQNLWTTLAMDFGLWACYFSFSLSGLPSRCVCCGGPHCPWLPFCEWASPLPAHRCSLKMEHFPTHLQSLRTPGIRKYLIILIKTWEDDKGWIFLKKKSGSWSHSQACPYIDDLDYKILPTTVQFMFMIPFIALILMVLLLNMFSVSFFLFCF